MTHQIKPSVTNPTIADIYEKIASQRLELAPDFQRRFVWTHEHQEEFLDTILRGFPFPEIYVCQGETDLEKLLTYQIVIDGQQRLTTIRNYVEHTFEKPLNKIQAFSELGETEKKEFLAYQLVVRDIGEVDDSIIKEIFRRINLTKFKLQDIEIHNAIYDGKFIQLAKQLAKEIDLSDFGVFHDSEFTRMVDIHFFLQVMSTIERNGYYSRDNELEKCIAEYNDDYTNSDNVRDRISTAISKIGELSLELDSIWFRKSNFFTMVVELSVLESPSLSELRERLNNFEINIMGNKHKTNEFGVYYGYMYAGTNHRKARVTRSDMFRKHVLFHE